MPRPRPSRAPESQRWCDDVSSLMYTHSRPIHVIPLCHAHCTHVHMLRCMSMYRSPCEARHMIFEPNTVRDMTQSTTSVTHERQRERTTHAQLHTRAHANEKMGFSRPWLSLKRF